MRKLGRALFRIIKGIYDILASYLLAWVLFFALLALGLHLLLELVVVQLWDFPSTELWWQSVEDRTGIDQRAFRGAVFVALQAFSLWLLRPLLDRLQLGLERLFDLGHGAFRWSAATRPRLRLAVELGFSLVVTALLVPFLLQPTLVPLKSQSPGAWLERAVNLADGTASQEFLGSVVGLYRKLYAEPPAPRGGLEEEEVARGLDAHEDELPGDESDPGGVAPSVPRVPPRPVGPQPMMDRWDPMIWKIAGDDPERFARVKAFIWVESGGRQYAISHTGCAGLMQFCSGTARREPFRSYFGTGQIYACRCKGDWCKLSRQARLDLESGDPAALERHRHKIPCDLSDARFDPPKIIAAGDRYIRDLSDAVGGNLYLMYIGYNSGPSIARKVYDLGGRDPHMDLDQIEVHLATTMAPVYGSRADRRARSLLQAHLPKLARAYERYYLQASRERPQVPSAVANGRYDGALNTQMPIAWSTCS